MRPLLHNMDVLVQGEVRAVRVALDEKTQENKRLETERAAAKSSRLHADRTARALAEENSMLLATVGELSASYASLMGKHASAVRRANLESRQASLRERNLQAALTRVKAMSEGRVLKADEEAEAAQLAEQEASERALVAEQRVEEAQARADDAVADAKAAREAADAADVAADDAAYVESVLKAKLARETARAEKHKQAASDARAEALRGPRDRSVDEWAALDREALYKAEQRERLYLSEFLKSHAWRMKDIAAALDELNLVSELFDTEPFYNVYHRRVEALMSRLEQEEYGEVFGMFLHYEMNLTMDKIHRLNQAACMKFDRSLDRYSRKVLLYNPYKKDDPHRRTVIKVPRVAPPLNKMVATKKKVEDKLNVESAENGRLALTSFTQVLQQLVAQDVGKQGMPSLPFYLKGNKLPIVISFDGTGFGSQSLNTIALNNPATSQSAQMLRIFGLGNVGDDRDGTTRLLGPNRATINSMIRDEEACITCDGGDVRFDIFVVTDVAALRHTEHLAASGWCGCSRDVALRQTPKKPNTVSEMRELLKKCHEPTCDERFILSHMPLPGEDLPRPCTAPGCAYGHNRNTVRAELAAMLAQEAELTKDATKKGKAAFSKWRMAHAHTHNNVQPGKYGEPMLHHDFNHVVLDTLHMAELNMPKIPWKHCILNNASDDARAAVSEQLKKWKHPLDCRRKDDNRVRAQKWFTGAKWSSFCAGTEGSPGGPAAIAAIVLIVAQDMQLNGSGIVEAPPPPVPAATAPRRPAGRGRGAFVAARAAGRADKEPPGVMATRTETVHKPTAIEQTANPADLAIIRDLYGSRAQTIINALLAFDAFFAWYYPLKESIDAESSLVEREARALDNCRSAIDVHEIYERCSIRGHGSFMPHGAIFKLTKDILHVGDVWPYCTSALELQNAETKRVASTGGSRRLQMSDAGHTRRKARTDTVSGVVTATTGYATTMAISTLRKLLGAQVLRRGDGVIALPESRRKERLLAGRTKLASNEVKMEVLKSDYKPRLDTCTRAFVRLQAAQKASGV